MIVFGEAATHKLIESNQYFIFEELVTNTRKISIFMIIIPNLHEIKQDPCIGIWQNLLVIVVAFYW